MESINRIRIRQRVSAIWDQHMAANGSGKPLKDYVKHLEKAADIHRESMGDAKAFAKDFGAGI